MLISIFVVITLFLILMKWRTQHKLNKFIHQLAVNKSDEFLASGVLFLNYKTEKFKEIDEQLTKNTSTQLLIFLNAPDWFIRLKSSKWIRHKTLPGNEVEEIFKMNENTLFLINSKSISRVKEVGTYLSISS